LSALTFFSNDRITDNMITTPPDYVLSNQHLLLS